MSYLELKTIFPVSPSPTDPANCCVGYKYKWLCGGNRNGPDSTECNRLMANRCSKKWDSTCETYSKDKGGVWSNNYEIREGHKFGTGDKFIRDVLRTKFCKVKVSEQCRLDCDVFSGDDVNSPVVCGYYGKCDQTCDSIEAKDLNDKSIHKCLENPAACRDVLSSVCDSIKNNKLNTNGTQIGDYCNNLEKSRIFTSTTGGNNTVPKMFNIGFYTYITLALAILVYLIFKKFKYSLR
jgi:hypothetical protein